jgi:hypothetical protein
MGQGESTCTAPPLKYAPSPADLRHLGQKPLLMMASVLREGVPWYPRT